MKIVKPQNGLSVNKLKHTLFLLNYLFDSSGKTNLTAHEVVEGRLILRELIENYEKRMRKEKLKRTK